MVQQNNKPANGGTPETVEQKIDRLAIAVKEGFDATASKAEVEGLRKEFKADLAQMASKADLAQMASKADLAAVKVDLRRIEATMVTKDYLDEKLADLKGDLIVKLRKTNEKLDFVITLLRSRSIISDDDLKRIRTEFQIFPQLP